MPLAIFLSTTPCPLRRVVCGTLRRWGISAEGVDDESGRWPWSKEWLGPPANPASEWMIQNGSLYLQYMDQPKSNFIDCGADCVAAGNARWIEWFGALDAGPFNVGCFADCFQSTCNCGQACSWCGEGVAAGTRTQVCDAEQGCGACA